MLTATIASKMQRKLCKLHKSMECGSEQLQLASGSRIFSKAWLSFAGFVSGALNMVQRLKPSKMLLANSDIKKLVMVPMTDKVLQKAQGQNSMLELK